MRKLTGARGRSPIMLTLLAVVAVACGGTATVVTTAPTSVATTVSTTVPLEEGPETTTTTGAAPDVVQGPEVAPNRLASHLFLPRGETRSIAGLGDLLEVITVAGDPVSIDADEVTAIGSGTSCLRFHYRDIPAENRVQTMCVVAFDETGDCAGLEPLQLDLDAHLDPVPEVAGNSDLLVGGELYAACLTAEGELRLQQPGADLPELFFNIVDALGDGAYSLGDTEFEAQRNGTVTTFGGEVLSPSWIVTVSREVSSFGWLEDGSFAFNDEDCSRVPSCTDDASLIREGDVFITSLGMGPDQFLVVMDDADHDTLDRFVTDRIGIGWDDIAAVHPDATAQAFNRLVSIEIMDQLLSIWDEAYLLREKGVIIGYRQPWFVDQALTGLCFPDPAERTACQRIEAAISDYELERITAWRRDGFRLWQAGFLSVADQPPHSDHRPHWEGFEGVIAAIGAQDIAGRDLRQTYGEAVRALAAEIGPATPVLLYLAGGPMTQQTVGEFCEAAICASDFAGAYEMAEGALTAALAVLGPDQFVGFGAALFEGSHFDIRQPPENFGFPLNRVGETGYNHPILNVWRAG